MSTPTIQTALSGAWSLWAVLLGSAPVIPMKPPTVLTAELRWLRLPSQHLEVGRAVGKNRGHSPLRRGAASEQVQAERSKDEADRKGWPVTHSYTGDEEGYGRG